MNSIAIRPRDFFSVLGSPERAAEIPESADIYGWLLGNWELDVRHYLGDLRGRGVKGEAHFARVLNGYAIQDLWTLPRRSPSGEMSANTSTGTTIRIWDAAIQAWRITWLNPVSGARDELVGRRLGNDIVQIGHHANGAIIRWNFTEIAKNSFRWTGDVLAPDASTWTIEAEFFATRIS